MKNKVRLDVEFICLEGVFLAGAVGGDMGGVSAGETGWLHRMGNLQRDCLFRISNGVRIAVLKGSLWMFSWEGVVVLLDVPYVRVRI